MPVLNEILEINHRVTKNCAKKVIFEIIICLENVE